MNYRECRLLSCCWLGALVLLPGCSETEGQISALKDRIEATRVQNQAAHFDLQNMNQKLSLTNRLVSSQASKAKEFSELARKSAGTERIFVKYRESLESSLLEFSTAVEAYRKKYLAP